VWQTYEFRNPVSQTTEPIDRPPLKNELPDPTGDNKYTKDMVPGYTGPYSGYNLLNLYLLSQRKYVYIRAVELTR